MAGPHRAFEDARPIGARRQDQEGRAADICDIPAAPLEPEGGEQGRDILAQRCKLLGRKVLARGEQGSGIAG